MRLHEHAVKVQASGCSLLANLLYILRYMQKDATVVLLNAMRSHQDDVTVQERSVFILAYFSSIKG